MFASSSHGEQPLSEDTTVAVIGLGYVGLPLAVAFAGVPGRRVVGVDVDQRRVDALRAGDDHTGETDPLDLAGPDLDFATDIADAAHATVFVVTVPTPVDEQRQPDLSIVRAACRSVAGVLKRGDLVVFESTVYPGVTDDICGPLLAELSGLACGTDFTLGYSPERINPGDKVRTLTKITKVVAGQDDATLARVVALYGPVIEAGLHEAPSIKVAEAAKAIENTQRDVNIALMNELSLIFDRAGVRTKDVLAAAGTKWNFMPFSPGLVGGHCIGVDPYYLTSLAERLNYHPEIILAGRRINDHMGAYVAQQAIKLLVRSGRSIQRSRIGILGLTFKENVPDFRNSKVLDIVHELNAFGATVLAHDVYALAPTGDEPYSPTTLDDMRDIDLLIAAVAHDEYVKEGAGIADRIRSGGILVDVRSSFEATEMRADVVYWSL